MSDSTDAGVETMLEAQSAPRTRFATEEGFDSDVEVAYTIWGTWLLTRGKEIQEYDDRNDLARFHFLVSIHAPAGGATSPSKPRCGVWISFQSTRPRGARR